MKVLSLFDGISCAAVALTKLDFNIEYYASEVDLSAIKTVQKNFPDIKHVGGGLGSYEFQLPSSFR